jgi:hypothetical protein
MSETGIPDVPAGGGVPPWAVMGVQLLDALVQRLKVDEREQPTRGGAAGWPPGETGERSSRLERACRLLSRRNERLARALGACRCWGLRADCPRCQGEGRPGALEVDAEAFAEVVLPLLRAQPELFQRRVPPPVEVVPEQ